MPKFHKFLIYDFTENYFMLSRTQIFQIKRSTSLNEFSNYLGSYFTEEIFQMTLEEKIQKQIHDTCLMFK